MEALQLRRGEFDTLNYVCASCERSRDSSDSVIYYGLPLPVNMAREKVIKNLTAPSISNKHSTSKICLRDTPSIREALATYQLFAFVLFNPLIHHDMQNKLQERYKYLDEDTGKSLLFFSYFQPDDAWLAQLHPDMRVLADEWEVVQDENPALSIDVLSMQLNIQPHELPCIVITTSLFDATDYIKLSVGAADITRILTTIAVIAEQLANDPFSRDQDSKLTNQLIEKQLKQTHGDLVRRHKIADIQRSLYAIFNESMHATTDDVVLLMQSKIIALQKARVELHELYESTDSEEFQLTCLQIDDTCDALLVWLQVSMPHLSQTYEMNMPKLVIPKDALESNSAKYLETYQILVRAYTQIMQDPENNVQIDYSPFVISLTKLFELEINLSIVQLIRYMNNIEMPAYYNRHQPGKIAKYSFKNNSLDFNMAKKFTEELLLPSIGQTYNVINNNKIAYCDRIYDILCRSELNISKEAWQLTYQHILDKWKAIYPRRNHVAHPDPVTLQEVKEIVALLNDIGDSFTYLAAIKRKLRDDD